MPGPKFRVRDCDPTTNDWAGDEFSHHYIGEIPRIGETLEVHGKRARVVRVEHVAYPFKEQAVAESRFASRGEEAPSNWDDWGFTDVLVGVVVQVDEGA
ncbi:MAG: hypothetical protein ACE37F_13110 [Nannocystaceae bacterium]|nr:hypothetical protein [bacterium]